jgi:hypothetical protein
VDTVIEMEIPPPRSLPGPNLLSVGKVRIERVESSLKKEERQRLFGRRDRFVRTSFAMPTCDCEARSADREKITKDFDD